MHSEANIIALIREAFGGPFGDAFDSDTASLSLRCGAVTADMVVDGVDFDESLYPLNWAGHRALAQNVSDLFAANATPVGFVWSLAVPPHYLEDGCRRLKAFVQGAGAYARQVGIALCGGDLSATSGPFVCAVTAFGETSGQRLTRTGASPGEALFVTTPQPLGLSAAGLRELLASRCGGEPSTPAQLAHCAPRPTPLPDGIAATACIDISDGLALDAHRLAASSGIRLDINTLNPVSGVVLDDIFYGGEDYVLLFTSPSTLSLPGILRIGDVHRGSGVSYENVPLPMRGYSHF